VEEQQTALKKKQLLEIKLITFKVNNLQNDCKTWLKRTCILVQRKT